MNDTLPHSAYSLFLQSEKEKRVKQALSNIAQKINSSNKENLSMSLTIKFYNVEHGSCTHIITPNGKHILVDVGSKSDKSIVKYIKEKYFPNGGTIDQLIITHPHEDHIWGIPDMYKLGLKPRILQRPINAYDIKPQQNFEPHIEIAKYANMMNQEYRSPVSVSDNIEFSNNVGGVDIDIFSAPTASESKDDLNTYSSIVTIQYCGFKFVLTGDNPSPILREMIKNNHFVSCIFNATVLLAPHHGRSGEFCKEFFDIVNPRLSVVSDKSIVHGTQEQTANLYRGRGVQWDMQNRYVFSTRYDGTTTFTINSNSNWFIDTSKDEY